MNMEEWLALSPAQEEILSLNKDGSGKYIPYEKIVEKLSHLCGHNWSTSNLHVSYINLPNRKTLVTGTIEVEVTYKPQDGTQEITRKLSGGANFVVNNTKIPYTTASVKSLAIMNAVKPLGKQFGWQLNEGEESPSPGEGLIDTEVKPIMDMVILKKYEKAIKEGDTKIINDIKSQYHVED